MEEARPLKPSLALKVYLGLAAFSLAGSALSRFANLDPGLIAPAASALTLLSGLAAVFGGAARSMGAAKTAAVLALIGLAGAGSEIAGLYTGAVFGRYEYTDAWAPVLFLPGGKPFPLLLPFAWMMMAGASALACRRWMPSRPWLAALAAGPLAALADVPMEPVMAGRLGYWRWLEAGPLPGGAPVMNFVGWMATTWAAAAILTIAAPGKDEERLPEPLIVLGVHTLFVLMLGLLAR